MSLITQSEVVRQAMHKEIVRLKELVVNRRNDRINLRVDMMTLQATDDEQHRKHKNSSSALDERFTIMNSEAFASSVCTNHIPFLQFIIDRIRICCRNAPSPRFEVAARAHLSIATSHLFVNYASNPATILPGFTSSPPAISCVSAMTRDNQYIFASCMGGGGLYKSSVTQGCLRNKASASASASASDTAFPFDCGNACSCTCFAALPKLCFRRRASASGNPIWLVSSRTCLPSSERT